MSMSTAEIRTAFLEFFASKQHQVVPSSSLVPGNDPTLLFTNAGMVQFKDVFLGAERRPYTRATSSQRVVRAGGKHNDLDNVGYTARHHTFFEMLGNFSFGDYFKKEAIAFAWEFLTVTLKLPQEKLWVTVFEEDLEAEDLWIKEIGVDPSRVSRIGAKDNFWSMGDTGPCGPCSEIFFDHGPEVFGGPPGTPDEDGDRYIEIWNLVFMQYNRHADGTMEPLPKPSVDTGMGLERIAAIMQDVHSNYETDLFTALIKNIAGVTGCNDLENKSLRVVADHIRSCSFLILDGVVPSNEGRGYVLRRIMRRAIRHGNHLGCKEIFLHKVVAELVSLMGAAYPELQKQQAMIEKVILTEEQQFQKTLDRGLQILEDALATLETKTIPGDVAFKLYDTYGFPADLTADVARDRGFVIDQDGFDTAMQAQRKRAQDASNFGADYNEQIKTQQFTSFKGYTNTTYSATVVELFRDGEAVSSLAEGEEGIIILNRTPFYAESGGQVGDTGRLVVDKAYFAVKDTIKLGNAFGHIGTARGTIQTNDRVSAEIDVERREAIKKNHTATHLIHAALRQILGDHITQKGSLVDDQRLRFDFSHFEAVTAEQLVQVELLVNQQIRDNNERLTEVMEIDEAKEKGAMALFGEKYEDEVRVVSLGDFSVELCGGIHVNRAGDIGLFKITAETGIAAGIRRIEAMTGDVAIRYTQKLVSEADSVSSLLKGDRLNIAEKVQQLSERSRGLEKEIERLKQKLASQAGASLVDNKKDIAGVNVIIELLEGADPKSLRGMVDDLKNKVGSGVIVLAAVNGDKVSLIAGVTKDLTGKVKAGDLIKNVATCVGGKGGGRPDMAQAGGNLPAKVPEALSSAESWLIESLSA